ncbi:hypothetical protein ICN84_08600 [Akkermansia glycaniphila]|uniref:NfeD family protein n=1 Tax=Akkermansia glycaniphila TaxID=1679444 RepID=UPI001C01EDB3|nr:hypothetical protein [Akkermansia glycaniphila]MBT9450132.1 hypothetical protein [Akkermansia glycaniphila]
MERIVRFLLLVLCMFLVACEGRKEESYEGKVVVIEVGENSLANAQSFQFMKRTLERAENEGARAVVFELNTPGGLAWETSDLMMKTMQQLHIPAYAFVNTHAISAGALVASACDRIYMAPVSSIGAAGIVSGDGEEIEPMMRRKVESAFDSFVRSVVTKKGHNPAVIRAMMIPSKEERKFGEVTVEPDALLTLTGEEAVSKDEQGKPILAAGIAKSVEDLLKQENNGNPVVNAEPTGFEQIAMWLAMISPLLILIGMAGIFIEFKTPGFGIGGIAAIVAFSLFFFGNNVAGNLAGYEMVALFVLGIALIIVEFATGGSFIVFGIAGVVCVLVALFGGMLSTIDVEHLLDNPSAGWSDYAAVAAGPAFKLALGCVGGAVVILLLMRYLPDLPLFNRLSNATASGGPAGSAVTLDEVAVDTVGVTTTELKPSGKALIDGKLCEVSSIGGVIPIGTPVCVVGHSAFGLLVAPVELDGKSK